MSTEEWRYVVSWPEYQVSSIGNVRRVAPCTASPNGRLLKLIIDRKGYFHVNLSRQGLTHKFSVHRLVIEAFVGLKPVNKDEIAHWDGNPSNNRASNLRWATRKENGADKIRHNVHPLWFQASIIKTYRQRSYTNKGCLRFSEDRRRKNAEEFHE